MQLESLLIILPMLLAGIIRVLTDKINILKAPIDFGYKLFSKRVFGESKTWQGLVVITASASIFASIFNLVWMTNLPVYYGFVSGLSYSIGELINSFIKRQFTVQNSQNIHGFWGFIQYFLDQIDGILLVSFASYFWTNSISVALQVFLIGSLLHFLIDILNHFFGSKKQASKFGLFLFYQTLVWITFSPLKLFLKPLESLPLKPLIISSNHPARADLIMVVESMKFQDFFRFAPFRFVVHEKYLQTWLGSLLYILGAISTDEKKLNRARPLTKLVNAIQEGYGIFLFYEGQLSKTIQPQAKLKTGLAHLYKTTENCTLLGYFINMEQFKVEEKVRLKNTEVISYTEFLTDFNECIYTKYTDLKP